MDEDEKEMLQEARARLSNTRGKKAKRKMREKQLEEGRRLATVQRKRELRASGIEMELKKRIKPKVREMDYNVEIPFEHMVPDGKFKPEITENPSRDQLMIASQHIEGSMRSEQEAKRKIEDERRMKRLKEFNLPAAINKINSLNEFQVPMKRNQLRLPAPQLTESEIQNFSKLVNQPQSNQITDMLIANADKAQSLLNPESIVTPQGESTVHLEAYNALLLSRSSTPLIGGFNPPLMSESSPAFTPNLIARNLTPSIDSLKLNWNHDISPTNKPVGSYMQLLPEPENQYEYAPEESSEEAEESESDEKNEKNEEVLDTLKSEVVKQDLPRPYVFNPKKYIEKYTNDSISDEVVNLVLYDMYTYPMKGGKTLPVCVDKELLDYNSLKEAQRLIKDCMKEEKELDYDKVHKEYIFDYSTKQPVRISELQTDNVLQSLKTEYKYVNSHKEKLESKTCVLESEIKEKTKEIQEKVHKIEKSIKKKYAKYDNLRTQNLIFSKLYELETHSLSQRLERLRSAVSEETAKEKDLSEKLTNINNSIIAWEWCNKT